MNELFENTPVVTAQTQGQVSGKLAWHAPIAEVKAIEVAEQSIGNHYVGNDGVGIGCFS